MPGKLPLRNELGAMGMQNSPFVNKARRLSSTVLNTLNASTSNARSRESYISLAKAPIWSASCTSPSDRISEILT